MKTVTSDVFETLYKKLNKAQKQAVDTIEGPVMVIAGPGTGKTQILTLRIANILKQTDVGADSILALTFTESGAQAMRKRLVSIIGSAAYKINIFTFHGFCNEVIKAYPESFPRIVGANNVTDIDQINIIEEAINACELELLKPYGDPLYYVRPALGEIKNLKRDDISPEDFEKLIDREEQDFKKIDDLYYESGAHKGKMKGKYKDLEKHLSKNKELLLVYRKYEEILQRERLFDFEDMIMEVVRVLRSNEDLRLRLQEKYQYILADEHQDANHAQNHILELLSSFHDNPNLFIVGDEKQAIYRFQGASLENFLYFKNLYPQAVLVSLENNYRSTQSILDGSHSLISKNQISDERLRIALKSASLDVHKKICIYSFTEAQSEYLFLIKDIEEKIRQGVKPYEIAILFRENRDVIPLVKVFEKTAIPFSVESGQDVLADEDITKLIALLKAVNAFGNDTFIMDVLSIDFLNIPSLDIFKVMSFARKEKVTIYEVLKDHEKLEAACIEKPELLILLYKNLSTWSTLGANKSIVDFFEIVVRESGFLEHVLKHKASHDKLQKLELFFTEIKKIAQNHKQYRLKDLIGYLDTLATHNIVIKVDATHAVSQGVRLMTAHRSKGQEFEHVYIIGATDGHWGNKRSMNLFKTPRSTKHEIDFDPIDDERRLFYVALTRARHEACITFSTQSFEGKELLPSQFLDEIDKEHCEKIDTLSLEDELRKQKTFSFAPALNIGIDIKDKKFLKQLFLDQGLSVTALNNYFKCPWQYFFENLIRIPRPQSKHQLYGTAVHEALRVFFEAYRREEDMTYTSFLARFEDFLKHKPLDEIDYKDSLKKGIEALGGYFERYKGTWNRNILLEYSISGVLVPFESENETEQLLVRGNIDKIEIDQNDHVTVVDYKTRKPLSRNEIEGLTKNATGDYKRQLVFYKLLLDNHEDGKYKMNAGMIDFIEPTDKGEYKREAFEISSNDVAALTIQIQKAAHEIATFSFWNNLCDDGECEYCRLRKLLDH